MKPLGKGGGSLALILENHEVEVSILNEFHRFFRGEMKCEVLSARIDEGDR